VRRYNDAALTNPVDPSNATFREHSWIRGSPVGAHLGRAWTVLECAGEEPASGREIPFRRDEDVDDLAELVDRPI